MNADRFPSRGPEILRAGPLRLRYEPSSGFVRRIRLGDREVLRGIYAAVRDPNWISVPGTLLETRRELSQDNFRIEFECRHRRGDIDFVWHGAVTGTADGVLRYAFEGEARSTFRRNRIGLCVLHPIRECAGAPARQFRVDGSRLDCRFPYDVEPQIFGRSSFRDLRSVAHEVEPGVWAEVLFEGETFEMEDQRNWTDASFKTYGTPLALPFPVEIPAGTRLRQCVTLRIEGRPGKHGNSSAEAVTRPAPPIRIGPAAGGPIRLPRLGLVLASHGLPLDPRQIRLLRALGLSHLRVDLHAGSPDWSRLWIRADQEATELGVDIELALHLPRDGHADEADLRLRLERSESKVARVLALREGEPATTRETLAAVRRVVAGWGLPVGAGSDAHFCELNRERALERCAIGDADFLFWAATPQVHADDDLSVMETLEAHAAVVRTARAFSGGKPLVVGPVTLRPRFNAVSTGPESADAPDELPRQVDPRQAELFGAAWTAGNLAALASAGIEAITYYETTGWRGVLERDEGSLVPARFPSVPGGAFPLYHVFATVAGYAAGEVLPCVSTSPRSVAALLMRCRDRTALLVANLEPETCDVDLAAFPNPTRVRQLTPGNLESATRDPEAHVGTSEGPGAGIGRVVLPAHAVKCMEWAGDRPGP